MALYELNRPGGSLMRCAELLATAAALRPYDISIKHSLAELHLRCAEQARTALEQEKHFREAASFCRECNRDNPDQAYAYVTLAKISLKRLEDALERGDPVGIEQSVREVEQALQDGFQRSPNDSYLRQAEFRMAEMMSDSARALAALRKAFETNPRSTFIATRLARLYMRSGDFAKAEGVFQAALAANNNEHRLHYAYSKMLIERGEAKTETVLYHLQRSFLPGDSNFDAQLLFGRQLFISGDFEKSKQIFGQLKTARASPQVRFALYYPLDQEYRGEVTRMEATYCFIARDGVSDWIYAYRDNVGKLWRSLDRRTRVLFKIAFNFAGPSAFDVQLEQETAIAH
jgi:tetratricopeptide (TPR) repeat protein